MTTKEQLETSLYHELLKKMVSIAYTRIEELTVEELEDAERAARICGSKYWMEIDRTLERTL